MRSDAEKTNKAAIKAKKKAEKDEAKAAAKAAKAAKNKDSDDGGGAAAEAPKADENANYIEIKSPMIGTFYRKPSPDKEEFAKVGDVIS